MMSMWVLEYCKKNVKLNKINKFHCNVNGLHNCLVTLYSRLFTVKWFL